jgi:hypothetical protein
MQGELVGRLQMKRIGVEHVADAVIFLGLLINLIFAGLILYFYVL